VYIYLFNLFLNTPCDNTCCRLLASKLKNIWKKNTFYYGL